MAYFPGKQTAKPSRSQQSKSVGGGSSPTPYRTSPALTEAENVSRMAANRALGVGDSSGRSPSDPNFGKGIQAPRSQFRSAGGASFEGGTLKTRIVSPAEFQRSLAQRQQVSRARREFLAPLYEQRRITGAEERRRRIDALTAKQRLVKEIRGQPLSELGRKDKQAIIDYIDDQFRPYERGIALFTPSVSGKIVRNLNVKLGELGTKEISRKITPILIEGSAGGLRPTSTISAKTSKTSERIGTLKRMKSLQSVRDILGEARGQSRYDKDLAQSRQDIKGIIQGLVTTGVLGGISGIVGLAEIGRNPLQFIKSQIDALRHPRETFNYLREEFMIDPAGVVMEFYVFGKGLNLAGRGVKRSPAGRYVQEELFIRSQPKEVQGAVRRILKAVRIQEKINPLGVKSIRNVNFLEVVSLTKLEAQALMKTLKTTDSVVFGSWAARTLGGKKLPKPKDVDLATADVRLFNKIFLENIPAASRKNYVIKGEKILRIGPGKTKSMPILDVKPIDRLIPQRSLLTRRGRIPVVGYVTKIKGLERIRKVLRINDRISELKNRLARAKTRKARNNFKRQILKLEKQRSLEIKRFSPSELAQFKKTPAVGGLDFPTQKIVTIKGIKMIGFGEQTVRKALGTLQVLIEKNARRAKDPASLARALEVQRAALKRSKRLTLFKKRKLRILDDTIRMLKSKEFSKLLERKVPGLTKTYPLVGKIDVRKLKNVNFKKIEKEALERIKVKPKGRNDERERKRVRVSRARRKRSRPKRQIRQGVKITRKPIAPPTRRLITKKVYVPMSKVKRRSKSIQKRRVSRLPKSERRRSSRLPRSKLQPSQISKLRPSKLRPSKIPKGGPSKVPQSKPSKLTPSMLKPSKLQPSQISKLRPSKLRPSKIPKGRPSRLTTSTTRIVLGRLPRGVPHPPPNMLKRPRNKKEEERVIRWVKLQKQRYRPSLAAVLFNITGIPKNKFLTGFEIRPILIRRKIISKKPQRLKRRTTTKRKKK